MDYKKFIVLGLVALFIVSLILSCQSDQTLKSPEPEQLSVMDTPPPGVKFLGWKKGTIKLLAKLKDQALITVENGGVIGGEVTLNNSAAFPQGAVKKDKVFKIEVKDDLNFAAVDFKPSYEFKKPVTVTLSYANLDLEDNDPEDLVIYWISEKDSDWQILDEDLQWNSEEETVTFKIKHFSRYAWSF